MMDVVITPEKLKGSVAAPDSKSHAHRLMIASAMANMTGAGSSVAINDMSEDLEATKRCLDALMNEDYPYLYCGESGSTLRFLVPLSVCVRRGAVFFGKGKLPERPLAPLDSEMEKHGVCFDRSKSGKPDGGSSGEVMVCRTHLEDGLDQMRGGEFRLPGDVSSQYITGLLMALPLIEEDSRVVITSRMQSASYVDITLSVLREFGIEINICGTDEMPVYEIKGGQTYRYVKNDASDGSEAVICPEGDWSNGAFWLVMKALGSDIELESLRVDSPQGDRRIVDIIKCFKERREHASRTGGEVPPDLVIDARDVPDLVPVVCVLAALSRGRTVVCNAERLRIKESDRIKTTVAMLHALGADIEERADGMLISGKVELAGGTCDGACDHRIVMAAATAATRCAGPVCIRGAEAVNKSYPGFFKKYAELGGRIEFV